MEYCSNWDKSKQRLSALWSGEIIDRCCIAVTAPLGDQSNYSKLPSNPQDKIRYWTDGELVHKRNISKFENTYFAGDAFPIMFPDLGAAGHAAFFKGSKYQLEDTVWFFPSIEEWQADSICFDRDSFMFQKTLELAKYFVDESKGRYFVSLPDTSGNLDVLAHLRGSENLMIDMMLNPDPVHEALRKVQDVWKETYDNVFRIVKDNNEGGSCVGWLHTWAPGFHGQMQSDISVMLSPKMFQDFVFPELLEQSNYMDYPLYHFDGHQQTRHLDMLLSIENLKMIQWTNVAGQPSPLHFIPQFKKIQAAGKGLLINIDARDIEPLMEQLSSKGLYLIVDANTKEEADYAVKEVERLTHE